MGSVVVVVTVGKGRDFIIKNKQQLNKSLHSCEVSLYNYTWSLVLNLVQE